MLIRIRFAIENNFLLEKFTGKLIDELWFYSQNERRNMGHTTAQIINKDRHHENCSNWSNPWRSWQRAKNKGTLEKYYHKLPVHDDTHIRSTVEWKFIREIHWQIYVKCQWKPKQFDLAQSAKRAAPVHTLYKLRSILLQQHLMTVRLYIY